jgi:broad specificity phosphatase PhoE
MKMKSQIPSLKPHIVSGKDAKALLTKDEPILNKVSMTHNSMPVAYFVRHGETDMNKDNDFRGDLDVPLNHKGLEQAENLVAYFHNIRPSAIYHSERSRTAQTIGPFAKSKNMKMQTLPGLDSLNTGNFAGQPKDEDNMEKMKWYREHPDSKIPGGDVVRDWQKKADKAIETVLSEGEKDGRPAIACCHGSLIKELSRYFHGDIKAAKVDPGGVVAVYKLPSGGFIAEPILSRNDNAESAEGS